MLATATSKMMVIGSLIIAVNPLPGAVKIDVSDGRPVVRGVYVNGRGPYKFLIDTGANINLIEPDLARQAGMQSTSQTELSSSAGKVPASQSDGNEVSIDTLTAKDQRFVLVDLKQIQAHDPEIRGALGQWFLAGFDYTIDLRAKTLTFGITNASGHRVPFNLVNGRMVIGTSLGDLVLDSGSNRLTLFDESDVRTGEIRTLAGSKPSGLAPRDLVIDGRTVWRGEALIVSTSSQGGVSGLLPLNTFRRVYICNTQRTLVYE